MRLSLQWHCGNRLWALRRRLGWTQEHLAERAKLTVAQIERAENRAKLPAVSHHWKIAAALGIDGPTLANYLVGLTTIDDLLAARKAA